MRNTSQKNLFLASSLLLVGGVSYVAYKEWRKIQELHNIVDCLRKNITHLQELKREPLAEGDTAVPAVKTWPALQNQLKDAVVQIFAEVAEFNWLEPYKSPHQTMSSGSGFFINEDGYLITNAHVVDQARSLSIQIPSFGKRRFDISVVGVSPDRDLALVRLKPESVAELKRVLGKIPVVPFGNSDEIHRSDEIMALGYPLGQQSLKSTTGVVSGQEHLGGQRMIQISAPINPGSSGGPSVNARGEYVGVNTSGILAGGAQNVGYIIPSSEVALFIKHLSQTSDTNKIKFLRKPFLGILFNPASDYLAEYLGNPLPAGMYIVGTQKGSPLSNAGVKAGSMIYEIDGYRLDAFGELNVPWSEDKISVIDYVSRLTIGDNINLLVYDQGKPRRVSLTFSESELAPIRRMYPGYEKIDYEIIGGMVIMPLAINHLPVLVQAAPELTQFMELQNQMDGALVLTHVFPGSAASRSRTLGVGSILKEVNGKPVKTLSDLRSALGDSLKNNFLTVKTNQNIFAVLPFDRVLAEEKRLSEHYFYPISATVKNLMAQKATAAALAAAKPKQAQVSNKQVVNKSEVKAVGETKEKTETNNDHAEQKAPAA